MHHPPVSGDGEGEKGRSSPYEWTRPPFKGKRSFDSIVVVALSPRQRPNEVYNPLQGYFVDRAKWPVMRYVQYTSLLRTRHIGLCYFTKIRQCSNLYFYPELYRHEKSAKKAMSILFNFLNIKNKLFEHFHWSIADVLKTLFLAFQKFEICSYLALIVTKKTYSYISL